MASGNAKRNRCTDKTGIERALDAGDVLDAFADLMAEIKPGDPEEIDALLREAELDPMQIEAEATALIAEARIQIYRGGKMKQRTEEARELERGRTLDALELAWLRAERALTEALARIEELVDEQTGGIVQVLERVEKGLTTAADAEFLRKLLHSKSRKGVPKQEKRRFTYEMPSGGGPRE